MFFLSFIMLSNIDNAKAKLQKADAILISASNGLSISEGINIFANNDDFQKYFGDFHKKYGVSNILQGALGQLPADAHDSFISQLHKYMIDDYHGSESFQYLKKLVNDKNYFILTSNGDMHFQHNGFDAQRIWEIEGNFFELQMNTPEWKGQQERFQKFIKDYSDKNVVQLELGIGSRNTMIKLPLMRMVESNKNWSFITLNLQREINILPTIVDRSIAIPGDIKQTLHDLSS